MAQSAAAISPLEIAHPMPRFDGGQIVFNEANHTYIVFDGPNDTVGTEYLPTSTLLAPYIPKFNADMVISRIMNGKNWQHSKYYGMSRDEIKAMWERNRDDSAARGTAMHAIIEQVLDGRLTLLDAACMALTTPELAGEGQPELEQFIRFYEEWVLPRGLVPWRVEIRVFSRKYKIAGSLDALFYNPYTGKFVIVDWKRSKDLDEDNQYKKRGLGVISHLPGTTYTKYALQQNVYRKLIEEGGSNALTCDEQDWDETSSVPDTEDDEGNPVFSEPVTPYRVEGLYLAVLHPNNAEYVVKELPNYQDEVQKIFDEYAAIVDNK